jgi:hypothetical protein
MVVGADGYKLEGPGARFLLQSIIISHDPGEVLHLIIRRGPKKMNVDAPLGRFTELPNNGPPMLGEDRLSRAWRIRAQARMGGLAEPIRVDGPAAPWGQTMDAAQRRLDIARNREINEAPLSLVGGGMPRAARNPDETRIYEQMARQQMVVAGQMRIVPMPMFRGGLMNDWDPDSGVQPMKPEEELSELKKRQMDLERRMALSQGTPSPNETKELQLLTKQYQAIEAEADEAKADAAKAKHSAADANPQMP